MAVRANPPIERTRIEARIMRGSPVVEDGDRQMMAQAVDDYEPANSLWQRAH